MTVHEVSKLTGVSIKTLHYYDAIGLLCPQKNTENGYRFYDTAALERLQQILLFRELKFPLKDIAEILKNPNFDKKEALRQQITLLSLQQKHLNELIAFAQNLYEKGSEPMNFNSFNNDEYNAYATEAREKWGDTQAYKEYAEKNEASNSKEFDNKTEGLMKQFVRFGEIKNLSPDSPEAKQCVVELQSYITANYYTCTNEILSSLGLMYTGDERFQKNIDSYGGEGTAAFASAAIASYTK